MPCALQDDAHEQTRLDDALGAYRAVENDIVALEQASRKLEPPGGAGEIIRPRCVLGVDDPELIEETMIDLRHVLCVTSFASHPYAWGHQRQLAAYLHANARGGN